MLTHNTSKLLMHIEVIGEGDAVPALNLFHFMFAVAVESRPHYFLRVFVAPVPFEVLASVRYT